MSSFHGRATARHNPARNALRAIVFIVALIALVAVPAHQVQATTSASVGTASTGRLTHVGVVDLATAPRVSQTASSSGAADRIIPYRRPYSRPAGVQTPSTDRLPQVQSSGVAPKIPASGSVLTNFSGIDSINSYHSNAFHVEPPDQGLCIGPAAGGAPGTTGILEMVNLAVTLYNSDGTVRYGPTSLNSFFGEATTGFGHDANFLSDPRCYYDATAHAWFATVLEADFANGTGSHIDVAVDPTTNPRGPWNVYQFDTTAMPDANCPCFGDQPLLGVDDHGVYVSTNEFPITGPGFNGAQVYAISKKDLLAGAASPFFAHYTNLTLPGKLPAATLQPAENPQGSTVEYFLNSLDPNATIDNRVQVWAATNDAVLDTGGTPTLTSTVITSELYGQPPNAVQKGSSSPLNTDDDRMQQVQNVNGVLWGALDSVILINGDVQSRTGAAWFKITPGLGGTALSPTLTPTIVGQGYTAFFGHYLLYPAIAVNDAGNAVMALSASGSDLYPTAGFAYGPTFQSLAPTAIGVQTDHGFTCTDPSTNHVCRWGDYGAAARDNLTGNIWIASEWIGGPGDALTNWSTQISEVTP